VGVVSDVCEWDASPNSLIAPSTTAPMRAVLRTVIAFCIITRNF
jgi:hypothetical protein